MSSWRRTQTAVAPSRGVLLGKSSLWELSYHSGWSRDTRSAISSFSQSYMYEYATKVDLFVYTCVSEHAFSSLSLSPLPSLLSQKSNPAELLRMYLTFDLLEPATLLAIEFIDAVCGHGKEYFGLKVIKKFNHYGSQFSQIDEAYHFVGAPTRAPYNRAYCSSM